MTAVKKIIPLIVAVCYIVLVLVAVSLLDVLLVFIFPRFYSTALFITTFGVGGIFAGGMGFMAGTSSAVKKDEWTRWSLIILIAGIGLLFFLFLSNLEGGEYEPAFKAYGITMVMSMLLFVRGKVE
jgi:peptidoglycan/LPS O-acetylase OafA/YrhL